MSTASYKPKQLQNPDPLPNPPLAPPPSITDAESHYEAAIEHEATANLHRQTAKLFEQNKTDEAKKMARELIGSSDSANKQSANACQYASPYKPQ